MTDLTTTVRPRSQVSVGTSPAAGATLITEQQVLFATAAAVCLPAAKTARWASARASVSSAVSAVFSDSRPPAQRYVARRSSYFENGLMAREMHRL